MVNKTASASALTEKPLTLGRSLGLALGLGLLLAACGGGAATTTTTTTSTDPAAAAGDSGGAAATAAAAAKDSTKRHRVVKFDTGAASGQRPLVRETYQYEGSVRDPFKPLFVAADRGPDLPNLTLIAIIYDNRTPANSIATFREKGSDRRYLWHPGDRFGRITVVRMTTTDVTLELDDFGVPRRQNYSLKKPEDNTP